MQLLFILLSRLPLPLLHVLGHALGLLLLCLPNRLRWRCRLHLERCFPELGPAARRRLLRQVLCQSACALLEGPRLWAGPAAAVAQLVRERRGWERVEAALARGRGLILAAPHLGAWEMAGLEYSRHHPITSLYKPQKGAWDALIRQGRERFGARLVPSDRGGVRQLLLTLRGGGTVGILPDQDPPPGSGVFAPFFGIPAHTPVLLGHLARRTGAAVIYMYAERLPRGRGYILHFLPAPQGVDAVDEVLAAAAVNAGVESCVRRLPQQYWWNYARFRRRPPGVPGFYRR